MTSGGGAGGASGDALDSSFVFVGCNRLSKGDWDPTTNPSSANLPQLKQTFTDIVALADRPQLLFFTGDLVLGLVTDVTVLRGQLDAWAQVYKADPIATKLTLVPLVGNHEMLYKSKQNNSKTELSNPGADAVWTTWLASNHFDAHAGNGPKVDAANADALQDDQSKLSYSFDVNGAHYVVLNTDTWTTTPDAATGSTQIGWVALHWLAADIEAAQKNPGVSSIFVFGHKPLVAPSGVTDTDATVSSTLVAGIERVLDASSKVKGYLCAHAHEWDARKLPGSRGVYQVIAGNGGSELESAWTASPPYYGFTEVRVYKGGRVGVVSHRRPVPTPYNAGPATPATAAAEVTIAE